MVKDLFFLYYLLSYSSGILALFLSAYLYFNSRDPLLKKYIVLMSLFFAFISINAAANYVPDSAAYSGFKTAMSWIILAACCPMIYLLPEFMASVFRISFKKKADMLFLSLAIASIVQLTVFSLLGRIQLASAVILGLLSLSIVFSLSTSVFLVRKNPENRQFGFLRTVNYIALISLPLILLFDLYRNRILPAFRLSGPIILPLIYFAWNVLYIRSSAGLLSDREKSIIDIPDSFCDDFKISKREREIAELLIKGKTYQEIMALLFISMPTVKTHVSSIYSKTGSKGKMDLAIRIQNHTRAQNHAKT